MRARLAAVLLLAGCNTPRAPGPVDAPPGVRVKSEGLLLRSGAIGVKEKVDASYVLVDVTNDTAEDRDVAVLGDLVDASGKEVEGLALDEMRVPAGGLRTFALVADRPVPEAVGAHLRVRSASPAIGQPSVIAQAHPFAKEAERTVQGATIRSVVGRDGHVTLAATFRDDTGAILARPFVILELRGGTSRDFSFVGPVTATRADVFVTDVVH